MYAIIEAGGRQWKVEPGTRLEVNRIESSVGSDYAVDRVLFTSDGKQVQFGRPYVQGAQVTCEVLEHPQGPKVISYHFRRRENWRKTVGHRQPLTLLRVKDILFPSGERAQLKIEAAPAKKAAKTAEAAETPKTKKVSTVKKAATSITASRSKTAHPKASPKKKE